MILKHKKKEKVILVLIRKKKKLRKWKAKKIINDESRI